MLKYLAATLVFIVSFSSFADTQCGPFKLTPGPSDGWFRVNNAQWLQASMNAPRQYATYDCVKVK